MTTLVELAAVVHWGLLVGGRVAVVAVDAHTVKTFRARAVSNPGDITRALAASRREIAEWVRRDSRLSRTAIQDVHVNPVLGTYLKDYAQEFLLMRAGGGSAELSSLGDVLTVAARLR